MFFIGNPDKARLQPHVLASAPKVAAIPRSTSASWPGNVLSVRSESVSFGAAASRDQRRFSELGGCLAPPAASLWPWLLSSTSTRFTTVRCSTVQCSGSDQSSLQLHVERSGPGLH